MEGDLPTARELYCQMQALLEELGDRFGLCNLHNNLGNLCLQEGEPETALREFECARELATQIGHTWLQVMIDHGLGLTTVYAHMDSTQVIEGQVLAQGDVIGTVGKTGRVTGAHLHWGMTWKSVHLDPMLATGPMPKAVSQK